MTDDTTIASGEHAPLPAARPRPTAVTVVAGGWALLSVAGAVQGLVELVGLVGWLQGALGNSPSNVQFGASIGAAGSGFAVWKGLRSGKRTAWVTLRRISWLGGAGFLLATGLLIFADPSSITLSGPTGQIDLDPEQRGFAIAAAATGALLLLGQALVLGRAEVRAFFAEDDAADGGS